MPGAILPGNGGAGPPEPGLAGQPDQAPPSFISPLVSGNSRRTPCWTRSPVRQVPLQKCSVGALYTQQAHLLLPSSPACPRHTRMHAHVCARTCTHTYTHARAHIPWCLFCVACPDLWPLDIDHPPAAPGDMTLHEEPPGRSREEGFLLAASPGSPYEGGGWPRA